MSKILFENVIAIDTGDQGSETWHNSRLGVITASEAHKIASTSTPHQTYVNGLIAEMLTGRAKEVSGIALKWGSDHEPEAYEFYTNNYADTLNHKRYVPALIDFCYAKVENESTFIGGDINPFLGCSPDGVFYNDTELHLIEIKCPYASEHHINTLCRNYIKPEYQYQMEYQMMITGATSIDFVSYDPRVVDHDNKLAIVPFKSCPDRKKKLIKGIERAVEYMQDVYKKLNIDKTRYLKEDPKLYNQLIKRIGE